MNIKHTYNKSSVKWVRNPLIWSLCKEELAGGGHLFFEDVAVMMISRSRIKQVSTSLLRLPCFPMTLLAFWPNPVWVHMSSHSSPTYVLPAAKSLSLPSLCSQAFAFMCACPLGIAPRLCSLFLAKL